MKEVTDYLLTLKDEKYLEFMAKLIPNVDKSRLMGIRTPELKIYASALSKDEKCAGFLNELPHFYFEENQVHAFITAGIKDYEKCLEETERFLPYIDNWATCDQLTPKVFKKNRGDLIKHIPGWTESGETYKIRFGIKMLMDHYLDDDFDLKYPKTVAKIKSDEYYVNMMIAWYFATALAKQYDEVLPFIEKRALEKWTHNKAIQKAVESYRIDDEKKKYLKSLKCK